MSPTTRLLSRFTRADLDPDIDGLDVLGLAVLGGTGSTDSQLIGELAPGAGSERDAHAKVAVLTGSVLAGALLRSRNAR